MKYVKLYIDNNEVDFTELPLALDYSLEDPENFQNKKAVNAFDIIVPATLSNDKTFNTFYNPSVEDLTTGEIFKNHRACLITGNGYELLSGKCFLQGASHLDKPTKYKINAYGGSADWMVDLKEATLYELLKDITFILSKSNIEASWLYDGTNEQLPYVFAPAKYANWLDSVAGNENNITLDSIKPALSVYWILYRGFKSIGYKVQSDFFNTEYFRRQVMPWVWGNFLSSEGTKYEVHNFMAKSTPPATYITSTTYNDFVDVNCTNDSTDGAFDNNNDYTYVAKEMKWTYNTPHYGALDATLSIAIDFEHTVTFSSPGNNSRIWLYWYINGVAEPRISVDNIIGAGANNIDYKTYYFTRTVNPGDVISAKIKLEAFGLFAAKISISAFQIEYFRIPLGGQISFDSYSGFKKHKFLDFLRGVVDAFDINISTDTKNKVILMEPNINYFNGDFINWDQKQDLSKESDLDLFSDYEKQVYFKFKEDSNDGLYKLIKDRNASPPGNGKYVLPDRFKTGIKDFENRFFSATMHYEANQFQNITGVAPQLVVLVPENISNTSRSEAQNTFLPKLCYYKGLMSGVGGWRFDGVDKTDLPYMFSVNYKTGGHMDPVLSYTDELINGFIGYGLLKKFYLQRLAIMRNGQYYKTWFKLNNYDFSIPWHREFKIVKGQKWQLIQINGYKPLQDESTSCELRKWVPITNDDFENVYPTVNGLTTNKYDFIYTPLKCLVSDIPEPKI